jgi:hypothetical protein
MKKVGTGIFDVTAVVAFVTWVSVAQSQDAQSVVDANGNMRVPEDYLHLSVPGNLDGTGR